MSWTVIHSAVNGGNLGEHTPLNLEFGLRLSSITSITHDLPTHHVIHGGSHHAKVEPYATDFLLKRDGVDMMGGLVVEADSEEGDENVHFAGLDWRHYLERRTFPFDPDNFGQSLYSAVQVDMFTIVEEILEQVLGQANSLDLIFDNGTSGVLINYRIEPGDSENMYEKMNILAEGEPGFDHEVTPDKRLIFYSPNKSVECSLILETGKNIRKARITNKGIGATRVVGLGAGSSRRAASLKKNTDLEFKYRRHDVMEDFGDVVNQAHLSNLTQGHLDLMQKSQLALSVELAPGHADDFWTEAELGCMVPVRANTGYEQIDDVFRLIAIDGIVSNEGDETLTLEFELASP